MQNVIERQVLLNDAILIAIKEDGENIVYTPISNFCEHLGLAPNMQRDKLKNEPIFEDKIKVIPIMTNGGIQDKFCLNVDALPMWLVTIKENRCKQEIRPLLRAFKLQAMKVLSQAFINQETINQTSVDYKDRYIATLEELLKLKNASESKINPTLDQETIRKANEYNKLLDDDVKTYDFNSVAKTLDMGRNNLFETCRNFGLLTEKNVAKQTYIDKKWFKVVMVNTSKTNRPIMQPTTRFTALGIDKVRRILNTKGYTTK